MFSIISHECVIICEKIESLMISLLWKENKIHYICFVKDSSLKYEIDSLPKALRDQVMDFISFLKEKNRKSPEKEKPKKRQFGALKGKIKLAPDFDEPLEDFKDYM